jgi:hypothetical protein
MALTVARPQPLRFLPVMTLKTLVYPDQMENETMLYRPYLMSVKPFTSSSGPFRM